MDDVKSYLTDLDDAILRGSDESRARALWHATDMLIAGRYSDEEISTFGEIIGRLADEIEITARAELASRLARFSRSPVHVVQKLAFDDVIAVAGPVLRESEQLDTATLVENASTMSQQHLLAISERKSLDEAVTDVLVTRGNAGVVNTVVKNTGARLSDFGFLHMVKRAEGDLILPKISGYVMTSRGSCSSSSSPRLPTTSRNVWSKSART